MNFIFGNPGFRAAFGLVQARNHPKPRAWTDMGHGRIPSPSNPCRAFGKCSALKPAHYASICYHDTSERNWGMLQDILLDVGFEILTVNSLDPKQKSQKQLTGEKVVKSDLVLNCRKPRPEEAQPDSPATESELVSNRVRDILVETLSKVGGQSRDKLWDSILKRLLSRGQMAEHRFDDILSGVAFRSESGRWFLKEEFDQLSQSDIRNEEDAGSALERFARLRSEGVPAQFAAHSAIESAAAWGRRHYGRARNGGLCPSAFDQRFGDCQTI